MVEAPRKFNASLEFSGLLPYEEFFAERIPLMQAFTLALAECHRRGSHANQRYFAAECGVYTGSSLLACQELASHHKVNLHFLGFDTFKGLPELSVEDRKLAPKDAPYLEKTLFADTSKEAVEEKLEAKGYLDNTKLISGRFPQSFGSVGERQYVFVNIDCDLYSGHIDCLEYFYPRMLPGGIIFFDDYFSVHFPSARKAIDKFLKNKPEKLTKLGYGKRGINHTKCFITKF